MNSLSYCLQRDYQFKKISKRMIVPPVTIQQFRDRNNYALWYLAMGLMFVFFTVLGTGIECWQRFIMNRARRKRSIVRRHVRRQGRMENNKAFTIMGLQEKLPIGITENTFPIQEKIPESTPEKLPKITDMIVG